MPLMQPTPVKPVKVPASAANYTAATMDPDLRSQINTLLLREGHVNRIQEHLLHSLDAHSSNWPSAIQNHAMTLLRNGEVSTFPALIRRVLEDVRAETAKSSFKSADDRGKNGEVNGATTNGSASKAGVNGTSNGTAEAGSNLAVPQAVVDAVLKAARESLEAVCEIEEGGSSG
ncbi:hypothetical protein F5Y15DRAFT_397721 [Xylariaceae sp. FL0016]|nr:hypothetical protein F5Y15DRAFT_397721 [Xylariaceae sp. FL0016]